MLRPVEVLALAVSAALLWWVLTLSTTPYVGALPLQHLPGY
jgi:hypothetical protein